MRTVVLIIVALIISFFLYQAFSNQTIEEEVTQAQKPIHPETIAAYQNNCCLLYTSPSPRDTEVSRMPSSA